MSQIYTHPTRPNVDVPQLDLLSFLFDSPHCLASEESLLHQAADDPSRKLNKAELRMHTTTIAHILRHDLNVGVRTTPSSQKLGNNDVGDHDIVTVISTGQPLLPAAFFGVLAAGGVYSSAHPTATVAELTQQLRISGTRVIICCHSMTGVVVNAAAEAGIPRSNVLVLESAPVWALRRLDHAENLMRRSETLQWETITDSKRLEESLVVIVWSSGTTGVPKGVKLSHRNLVSQAYLSHLTGRERADELIAQGLYIPWEPRSLAHLPASHIAGLFGYFISNFYAAALTVWMERYEWNSFLRYMSEHRITSLFTVPSIWQRIAQSSDVRDQFSHLRYAQSGSAPFEKRLQTLASERISLDRKALVAPTWGLSETTGSVTSSQSDELDEIGTLGAILPGVQVRLVDEDTRDIADGSPGELIVRGPVVSRGYFRNPQATRDAFLSNGWFRTGDVAMRSPDGKLVMVDRKKELLKYKAMQIAPAELESLLARHPDILEAAVVGVPAPGDPSSDLPRAYIVAASDALNAVAVHQYMSQHAAKRKQLRGGVVFVKEIPKTAIGKVKRGELRQRARDEVKKSGVPKL